MYSINFLRDAHAIHPMRHSAAKFYCDLSLESLDKLMQLINAIEEFVSQFIFRNCFRLFTSRVENKF